MGSSFTLHWRGRWISSATPSVEFVWLWGWLNTYSIVSYTVQSVHLWTFLYATNIHYISPWQKNVIETILMLWLLILAIDVLSHTLKQCFTIATKTIIKHTHTVKIWYWWFHFLNVIFLRWRVAPFYNKKTFDIGLDLQYREEFPLLTQFKTCHRQGQWCVHRRNTNLKFLVLAKEAAFAKTSLFYSTYFLIHVCKLL